MGDGVACSLRSAGIWFVGPGVAFRSPGFFFVKDRPSGTATLLAAEGRSFPRPRPLASRPMSRQAWAPMLRDTPPPWGTPRVLLGGGGGGCGGGSPLPRRRP